MKNYPHILLVSGSTVRRRTLTMLLRGKFPAEALKVFSSLDMVPPALEESAADIFIADLESPGAVSAVVRVVQELPGKLGIVALIDDPAPDWMQAALEAGVNAFISRSPDADELELAITAAEAGLILLHPSFARSLGLRGLQPRALTHNVERLTAREVQVLRLIGEGLGNKEIAARLDISEHTAKFHTSSILGKLGVASRTEAVSEGIKRGLIPI